MATLKYQCAFCGELFRLPNQACQSLGTAETCLYGSGYRKPAEPKEDLIKTPKHYAHWAIEPKEFIMRNDLDFATGNVIKYVMRHKDKNGREDLEKAKEYIDWLIQADYPE